jgi:hypothetical protein
MKETQAEVIMLRWHKRPLLNMRKIINGVRVWSRGAFTANRSQQSTAPIEPPDGHSTLHPRLEKQGPNNAVNDKNNTTPDKSQLVYYSALVSYNLITILTVAWKTIKE